MHPDRHCVWALGWCKREGVGGGGVVTHDQIRQSGERMFVTAVGSFASLWKFSVWRRRCHRPDRSFKSLQRKSCRRCKKTRAWEARGGTIRHSQRRQTEGWRWGLGVAGVFLESWDEWMSKKDVRFRKSDKATEPCGEKLFCLKLLVNAF